jgi:hypothetical protein
MTQLSEPQTILRKKYAEARKKSINLPDRELTAQGPDNTSPTPLIPEFLKLIPSLAMLFSRTGPAIHNLRRQNTENVTHFLKFFSLFSPASLKTIQNSCDDLETFILLT